MDNDQLQRLIAQARQGGASKYHEKNSSVGKLFARSRIHGLLDEGSFVEDALLANQTAGDLPADRRRKDGGRWTR